MRRDIRWPLEWGVSRQSDLVIFVQYDDVSKHKHASCRRHLLHLSCCCRNVRRHYKEVWLQVTQSQLTSNKTRNRPINKVNTSAVIIQIIRNQKRSSVPHRQTASTRLSSESHYVLSTAVFIYCTDRLFTCEGHYIISELLLWKPASFLTESRTSCSSDTEVSVLKHKHVLLGVNKTLWAELWLDKLCDVTFSSHDMR